MNIKKSVIAVSAVILCSFAGLCIYALYEGPSISDNTVYSFGSSDKFSDSELKAASDNIREYFKANLHFGDDRRPCELLELSYDESSRDNMGSGNDVIWFDSKVRMFIDGEEVIDKSLKFAVNKENGEYKKVTFGRC